MNIFTKVEELREFLQKKYPSLQASPDKPKNIRLKALSVEPAIVRPTIKPHEVANMLQYSSKHKNIKDIDYGPLPRKTPPIKIKAQKYEAETGLDCFMKHIATKSFEQYVMQRIPGFRKTEIEEVSLSGAKREKKRKVRKYGMNAGNLEVFGQVEVRSVSPKFEEKNLKFVAKGIQRSVRSWCLQERRKTDPRSQLIDHFTFKYKHN